MVYGIVIHKVRGNFKASEKLNGFNAKGSESSKTEGKRATSELYSQFFCPEGNDSKREVRVQHLISVVNSEVHFRNSSRTSQGFQITETLAGTPAVATNTLPNKNNNSRATPANASDPNMSLARVLSFSSPRPKGSLSTPTQVILCPAMQRRRVSQEFLVVYYLKGLKS